MKKELIPAILAKNFKEFKQKVEYLEPYFNLLQIDVMDGRFVNNKTYYNLDKIKTLKTKAGYELHLMVSDPIKIINKWKSFKKKSVGEQSR